MKAFKLIFYISIISCLIKIGIALYGLIFPQDVASEIIRTMGVESLAQAEHVARGLGKYVTTVMWGLLVISLLNLMCVFLMSSGKRFAFFIYCFVNAIAACICIYAGINFFTGFEYFAIFPFIGMMMYTFVLEQFWFGKPNS